MVVRAANRNFFIEVQPQFSSALYMKKFLHGPQGSVLRGKYCYIEFHPEHSPVFSDVLHSHVTSSHPFYPTLPFEILASSGFHSHSCIYTTSIISIMDAICPGYHGTILEPFRQSQNVIGSITDIFRHFYHLNHASTLRRFQYCVFYSRLYYYSVVVLSLVV